MAGRPERADGPQDGRAGGGAPLVPAGAARQPGGALQQDRRRPARARALLRAAARGAVAAQRAGAAVDGVHGGATRLGARHRRPRDGGQKPKLGAATAEPAGRDARPRGTRMQRDSAAVERKFCV
eukprot:scaffold127624_cov63-Phaeocystis_antarctica.AAC.1